MEYHDRGIGLVEASVSLASLPDYEAWAGKKFPKASASQTPSLPNVGPPAIPPVLVTTKVPAVHVSSDSLASKTPKKRAGFSPNRRRAMLVDSNAAVALPHTTSPLFMVNTSKTPGLPVAVPSNSIRAGLNGHPGGRGAPPPIFQR